MITRRSTLARWFVWDHGPLTSALQTFIGRGALPSCPSLFDGRGRGKLSMDLRACGCLLDGGSPRNIRRGVTVIRGRGPRVTRVGVAVCGCPCVGGTYY